MSTSINFPIKQSVALFEAVLARVKELGYNYRSEETAKLIRTNTINGCLCICDDGRIDWNWPSHPDLKMGSFDKLFNSNEYKFDRRIDLMLGKYLTKVYRDRVVVGCETFSLNEVQKVIAALKTLGLPERT